MAKEENRFEDIVYEILEIENMCKNCNIPLIPDLPEQEGPGDFAVLTGFSCPKCGFFRVNFGERDVGKP